MILHPDDYEPRGWIRVTEAADCDGCEDCGELVCRTCRQHYDVCACPGPSQDDLYEYQTVNGVLMARPWRNPAP